MKKQLLFCFVFFLICSLPKLNSQTQNSKTVKIAANLTVSIKSLNGNTICSNQSATLKAIISTGVAPYQYKWFAGVQPLNIPSNQDSAVVFPKTDIKLFKLTVIDSKGDSGTANFSFNVLVAPNMQIETKNYSICSGERVINTATGADFYNWIDPKGQVINTDSSVNTVSFIPSESGTYFVIGSALNNCTSIDSLKININPISVKLKIGDLTNVKPNQDNIKIPIIIQDETNFSTCINQTTLAGLKFKISLDWTLFHPQSVTSLGKNNDTWYPKGVRKYDTIVIPVSVDKPMKKGDTIAFLNGVPLLGDTNYSKIKFLDASFDNFVVNAELVDGSLSFDPNSYCAEGGVRYITYMSSSTSFDINPNPIITSFINMRVKSKENCKIFINDILGRPIKELAINKDQFDYDNIKIEVGELLEGSYIIILNDGYSNISKNFSIIK